MLIIKKYKDLLFLLIFFFINAWRKIFKKNLKKTFFKKKMAEEQVTFYTLMRLRRRSSKPDVFVPLINAINNKTIAWNGNVENNDDIIQYFNNIRNMKGKQDRSELELMGNVALLTASMEDLAKIDPYLVEGSRKAMKDIYLEDLLEVKKKQYSLLENLNRLEQRYGLPKTVFSVVTQAVDGQPINIEENLKFILWWSNPEKTEASWVLISHTIDGIELNGKAISLRELAEYINRNKKNWVYNPIQKAFVYGPNMNYLKNQKIARVGLTKIIQDLVLEFKVQVKKLPRQAINDPYIVGDYLADKTAGTISQTPEMFPDPVAPNMIPNIPLNSDIENQINQFFEDLRRQEEQQQQGEQREQNQQQQQQQEEPNQTVPKWWESKEGREYFAKQNAAPKYVVESERANGKYGTIFKLRGENKFIIFEKDEKTGELKKTFHLLKTQVEGVSVIETAIERINFDQSLGTAFYESMETNKPAESLFSNFSTEKKETKIEEKAHPLDTPEGRLGFARGRVFGITKEIANGEHGTLFEMTVNNGFVTYKAIYLLEKFSKDTLFDSDLFAVTNTGYLEEIKKEILGNLSVTVIETEDFSVWDAKNDEDDEYDEDQTNYDNNDKDDDSKSSIEWWTTIQGRIGFAQGRTTKRYSYEEEIISPVVTELVNGKRGSLFVLKDRKDLLYIPKKGVGELMRSLYYVRSKNAIAAEGRVRSNMELPNNLIEPFSFDLLNEPTENLPFNQPNQELSMNQNISDEEYQQIGNKVNVEVLPPKTSRPVQSVLTFMNPNIIRLGQYSIPTKNIAKFVQKSDANWEYDREKQAFVYRNNSVGKKGKKLSQVQLNAVLTLLINDRDVGTFDILKFYEPVNKQEERRPLFQ